jgi:ABC-type transporter Mla subunit MlaD
MLASKMHCSISLAITKSLWVPMLVPLSALLSVSLEFPISAEISDSIASIRGKGLLGDKYVSISPGGADENLKNGSRITDTEASVDLESLLSRFAFGAMQSEKKTSTP